MTQPAAKPSVKEPRQVLSIPIDTVCFIVGKLREQGNECRDTAVLQELHSVIDDLPQGQQVDLVALTWLGRDNCLAADWPAIRGETAEAYYAQTARYLLGMSMVGDFMEKGLSILGFSGERTILLNGMPEAREKDNIKGGAACVMAEPAQSGRASWAPRAAKAAEPSRAGLRL